MNGHQESLHNEQKWNTLLEKEGDAYEETRVVADEEKECQSSDITRDVMLYKQCTP
jgi:hypothetical protein